MNNILCKVCKKELTPLQIKRNNKLCSWGCRGKMIKNRVKGENHWLLGKTHSQEVKEKISQRHKGKRYSPNTEFKVGSKKSVKGYRFPKGKSNPAWNGGRGTLRHAIMAQGKYAEWRKAVFKRDNYTCQICFVKGGELNADHIKWFSQIIRENNIKTVEQALVCAELWNINNGRTLCRSCHLVVTFKDPRVEGWSYAIV